MDADVPACILVTNPVACSEVRGAAKAAVSTAGAGGSDRVAGMSRMRAARETVRPMVKACTSRGCQSESQAANYRDKRRPGCVFYFHLAILDRPALKGFAQVG